MAFRTDCFSGTLWHSLVGVVLFLLPASASANPSSLSTGAADQITVAANVAPTRPAPSPIAGPLKWKSSGVLIKPISDENHQLVSVKDPTVVFHNDQWHVYATTANQQGHWSMIYLTFKDWSEARDAKPYYIDLNPRLDGYHCAPFVFYFRPHKKWYLIYQSQHPQYSTTEDISKPESWSEPQNFFAGKPASAPQLWIDYWMICDDTHAYLFFTGDNGRLYRSRTTLAEFPAGMSEPEIAIKESRDILFEGSMTYKIKGTDKYLTLVEALSPSRFYRAFLADRLDGEWTPVPGANTHDEPFAGIKNLAFEEGVEPWTAEVSHGEMIRDSNDETVTIDVNNLQMLYQGRHPSSNGRPYHELPYRLGLLKLYN
jgi:hypothetical protein